MTALRVPRAEDIKFSEVDVRRAVQREMLLEEIAGDSDRGKVLALACKVEFEAKGALANLLGDSATSDAYEKLSFAEVIRRLEKFRIISRKTAELLNEFRELRNEAAHSVDAFHLWDKTKQSGKSKAKSHSDRAAHIVSALRKPIDRVRGDPAWAHHQEDGLAGDFEIAVRLLWEGLHWAARELTPLADRERAPVLDVVNMDGDLFCAVTDATMCAASDDGET